MLHTCNMTASILLNKADFTVASLCDVLFLPTGKQVCQPLSNSPELGHWRMRLKRTSQQMQPYVHYGSILWMGRSLPAFPSVGKQAEKPIEEKKMP